MQYRASKLLKAESLGVETRTLPDAIPDGWVRLRLATAGICGTDMHYYAHFQNAGFQLTRPITLGHEASAYVEDGNGSRLEQGRLVALNPIIPCGGCDYCRREEENLCTDKRFPGSATTVPHIDGFFQEYFDFPAACCTPVPDGVSAGHLAFAEPLSCSLHAVNKADVKAGDRVLVVGCGPMGLLAVIAALSKGAAVECTDLRRPAVDLAVQLGAARGYCGGEFEPGGLSERYDAVIEASGAIAAFNQSLEWVRKGGVVSILSNIQPGGDAINIHRVMLKEIHIVGSFQFNREFEQALDIIGEGRFDFDALTAGSFPVSETALAFDLALGGSAIGKVQITGL